MPKGPTPRSIEELFWLKVDRRGDDECWPWTAYVQPNGYAKFRYHQTGTTWQAHRLAWTLLRGPIPDGLTIDHLCRNTLCMNPAHMDLVTRSVNVKRGLAVRYAGKTHCKQGHERTPENTIIRKDGRRECRVCDNLRSARTYASTDAEMRKAQRRAYYEANRERINAYHAEWKRAKRAQG